MKYWIVSLGVIWLMLPGCKARQQIRTHYRVSGISESAGKDSLSAWQWASRLKNRQAEVRQMDFMPPDSDGRQAIRTIRLVTIKETVGEEGLAHTTNETSGRAISSYGEAMDSRERFSAGRKRKWLLWVAPVVFLCGGMYLRLRRFFR